MIWPAFLLAALIIASVGWADRPLRMAALAFAAGVGVMAFWPVVLPAGLLWLASCGTWVAVAATCARTLPDASFALLLSALCYPCARLLSAEFGQSHPPAILADLFGVVALGVMGWRCRGQLAGIVDRGTRLGTDRRRGC